MLAFQKSDQAIEILRGRKKVSASAIGVSDRVTTWLWLPRVDRVAGAKDVPEVVQSQTSRAQRVIGDENGSEYHASDDPPPARIADFKAVFPDNARHGLDGESLLMHRVVEEVQAEAAKRKALRFN